MSTDARVRAIRGAITVAADDPDLIVAAAEELLGAVVARNDLRPADLVSVVFTSTPDLTSAFPAAGARRLGLGGVPLLCATEIAVPGALPRCIRILAHAYTARDGGDIEHPYLGDARMLPGPGGDPEPQVEA